MPSRLLCIDDVADIREIVALALEDDFEVHLAASGAEGLALFDDLRPDLVLLDVMMPGMDGPTTLRLLRERPAGAQLPVVFFTAKVQPQDVAAWRALGALDVIAKPFDPIALPARLQALSARPPR